MITLVKIIKNTFFLIDIFDKSEQENSSGKELQDLIDDL
jgi:hypothetical protein